MNFNELKETLSQEVEEGKLKPTETPDDFIELLKLSGVENPEDKVKRNT